MICEDQYRHRSELFCERSESKICFGRARNPFFHIRETVTLSQQDLAILNYGDACPGSIWPVEFNEKSINFGIYFGGISPSAVREQQNRHDREPSGSCEISGPKMLYTSVDSH